MDHSLVPPRSEVTVSKRIISSDGREDSLAAQRQLERAYRGADRDP